MDRGSFGKAQKTCAHKRLIRELNHTEIPDWGLLYSVFRFIITVYKSFFGPVGSDLKTGFNSRIDT